MTLLAPWCLLGWLLVPVLFAWGLLAPRGRRVTVGSLLLWRRALGKGAVDRPSARLRLRDPVVWLDAAAIGLIVLACARPALRTHAPVKPVATVIIDRTSSMSLPSDGPAGIRWKDAHRLLTAALDAAGAAPLRVVQVPGPNGVVRADTMPASDLLAGDGSAPASVATVEDVARVTVAEAVRASGRPVLLVTDVAPGPAIPNSVFVLAPGGASANVGLVRVAARCRPGPATGGWLFVEGRAMDTAPAPYDLAVYEEAKPPRLIKRAEALARPGRPFSHVLELNVPGPVLVRLEGPNDGYPTDNHARVGWPARAPIAVRVVGACDGSLLKALEVAENVQVALAAPATAPALEGADVVVVSGGEIPAGWAGAAVLLTPAEAVGPIRPTPDTVPAEWRVAEDHPLAEALYLPPPRLDAVTRYQLYARARVLLGTAEAPLIVTWSAGDARRMAVLLDVSANGADWPRRAGFPVFWSRAMAWLAHREDGAAYGRGNDLPPTFIGTDEGYQAGQGRDDTTQAKAAVRDSVAAAREASLAPAWPLVAALAVVVLVARLWVAR